MTMMGDTRECAKAVSAFMLQGPKEAKKAGRQAERVEKAYVFGHYDSRGGAALVIAKDHVEALKKYARSFGSFNEDLHDEEMREHFKKTGDEAEYDGWRGNAIDALQDDFIKRVELIVCDEPLPEDEAELDEEYEGAYRYGKVQQRYEQCDYDHAQQDPKTGLAKRIPTGKFSKWTDVPVMVMWKGRTPPKLQLDGGLLQYEHRIVREKLGEDACGLVLVR